MPEHALKEWAVVIDALLAGDMTVVLRKGGIGEKRFEVPHERFFLFPTHLHQRPDLVRLEARERFAAPLARREEPDQVRLDAWCEVHAAHPVRDPDALAALAPFHILSDDYAAERLRWRRTQPLWALVLRASRVIPPPVIAVGPEHGGCVSWVALPEGVTPDGAVPALGDEDFARVADAVEAVLAAATPRAE
ncbi:MAG: DUF1802 family protein [Thermoleophilia bacterium]|nr:DUF1802 family protein [Thermoleophilia bacterium]